MQSGRRRWLGGALAAIAGGLAATSGMARGAPAAGMTFEVYKDRAGEFRWRLKASNGQIVAASGQGYKAKADLKHAIEQIQKQAASARIEEASESA
jgi:uncharacterized protein YegP (UPF0339 family)